MKINFLINFLIFLINLFKINFQDTSPTIYDLVFDKSTTDIIIAPKNKLEAYKYYKLTIPKNELTEKKSVDLTVKVKSTIIYDSFVYPRMFISKVNKIFNIIK